jgi:hypothetical protein
MVTGPLGFRGRPAIALAIAAGIGGILEWIGFGLRLGLAATVVIFLFVYLFNRSKAG